MNKAALLLCAICLMFPPAIKGETDSITVETFGLGKSSTSEAHRTWKAFGGQTLELSLRVWGGQKEKFEIQADLFLVGSGNIAAPINKDIPIPYSSDLARNLPQQIIFSLEIPAVERACDFIIRYRIRIAGDTQWRSAGYANIRAYPKDILKPIQVFAERNHIYLYGANEKLGAFLKDKQIKFEDMKDNFPTENQYPCLILAQYADKDWFKTPQNLKMNQAMIIFHSAPDGLPRIIARQAGRGILVDVKMELIDKFMHDPEAQELLVELFNLALGHLLADSN
jgi:hypothetical protein